VIRALIPRVHAAFELGEPLSLPLEDVPHSAQGERDLNDTGQPGVSAESLEFPVVLVHWLVGLCGIGRLLAADQRLVDVVLIERDPVQVDQTDHTGRRQLQERFPVPTPRDVPHGDGFVFAREVSGEHVQPVGLAILLNLSDGLKERIVAAVEFHRDGMRPISSAPALYTGIPCALKEQPAVTSPPPGRVLV
jgi:hypothetical protein